MHSASYILQGRYLDSVKLMLLSQALHKEEGVREAVAVVASEENKAILKGIGMLLPEFETADPNSICIAVQAEQQELAEQAVQTALRWIEQGGIGGGKPTASGYRPRSLEAALKMHPAANLALISVAGKHAGAEAKRALELGLHVMLFSDNVPLAVERELKELALAKGLLLMGPDCGTAILDGIPLAFANAVRRGGIGIVSAAGTGLQAVSSEIHNLGAGISQAFGTGGRDGSKEIGGLMLRQCLQRLIADSDTEVIVLIAKPPHPGVIDELMELIAATTKTVVVNFLGEVQLPLLKNLLPAQTLSEAALKACQALSGADLSPKKAGGNQHRHLVTLPKTPSRKYLRGLYSGGTLCYEAQLIFAQKLGFHCASNAPLRESDKLIDPWHSTGHCILDLGADEFTVGRPHPMIDYSLRLKLLQEQASQAGVAVLLFDVVLGHGSHPAPQEKLAPLLSRIGEQTDIVLIGAVIGTDGDPQNKAQVIAALESAGAVVCESNSEAASLACSIVQNLEE